MVKKHQLVSAALLAAFSNAATAHDIVLDKIDVTANAERKNTLDLDRSTSTASQLDLTARETPASIEIVDSEIMRERGYRTVSEAAQGAVGVTVGDAPGDPANYSMRGLTNNQINTLYNGIKIGPANMTSRMMDTANLARIEILKGPASVLYGEGAIGGAINYITKQPHHGKIENEAFFSVGSWDTTRAGFGSGGGTGVDGLDYRFDLVRSGSSGYVDNTDSKFWHLSTALDYRANDNLKLTAAFEYKKDEQNAYWGTPLVSKAFAGSHSAGGIVSGTKTVNGVAFPVTIDDRTKRTNYNVNDNDMSAHEYWLRLGAELKLADQVTFKDQFYYYEAKRNWLNSEVYQFNPTSNLIDRDRFFVAHDQNIFGNRAEMLIDGKLGALPNKLVVGLDMSTLDFDRPGTDFSVAGSAVGDSVSVLNPTVGSFGGLAKARQTTKIDNIALFFEDRLKITQQLALVAGLRSEVIDVERHGFNAAGAVRANQTMDRTWRPTTWRLGMVYDATPDVTLYGQYATASDLAANNIFLIGANQNFDLTESRQWETGVKTTFWQKKGDLTLALYDIERKNVWSPAAGQTLNQAGKQSSQGIEVNLGLRPTAQWNLWGNYALVHVKYDDFVIGTASLAGNRPPNVPATVANAGLAYRFATDIPVEVGGAVRQVGDRYNDDANTIKMLAYITADAYASIDVKRTKVTFRVRNLTDRKYAIWGDPFYPDQVLLGAPRSFELSVVYKF
ncbi:MAG TPA: TonB-dependent receptor [Methylophilaceae bacterium]|nr:TonB-dependent receptor [Methylophilaceae bacterium]